MISLLQHAWIDKMNLKRSMLDNKILNKNKSIIDIVFNQTFKIIMELKIVKYFWMNQFIYNKRMKKIKVTKRSLVVVYIIVRLVSTH